jgi:glycine reductase
VKLTTRLFPIERLEESGRTLLNGRVLCVSRKELETLILQDERFRSVQVDFSRPGEFCRIINILDIFEPSIKGTAEGGVYPGTFPGILGNEGVVGSGVTNVVRGAAVITCGPMDGAEDGLLDMSGPCAKLSHFSHLESIVVTLTPAKGLSRAEFSKAAVQAGVRAAHFLAATTEGKSPEESREFELPSFSRICADGADLPRVAYVYFLYSHGDLRDMLVYGRGTRELPPTLIHPNEVMDGAIVWEGFSRPTKNMTYDNQNNGVIRSLYEAHGKTLVYTATILANHHKLFAEKTLHAERIASLAGDVLGVDGVIITKDGGGQADTDLMQTCERCEERGVKTTILAMEFAGAGGTSEGALADNSPRADAIVAVGDCAEMLDLPRMERVVGGERLKDYDQDPRDPLRVPYNKIPGPISFFGDNFLCSMEF